LWAPKVGLSESFAEFFGLLQEVEGRNMADLVCAHVWVKGRVQSVAEGERGNVDRFIVMVKEGPRASRVDESRVEWEDVSGEYREFGVKRSM
jgi:acylphosphatase